MTTTIVGELNRPRDPADADAEREIRERHETRKERDLLRVEVTNLRARLEIAEKLAKDAATSIAQERARADGYMRTCTELMTVLNGMPSMLSAIADIATQAATTASHGPFARNGGGAPLAEEKDDTGAAELVAKLAKELGRSVPRHND